MIAIFVQRCMCAERAVLSTHCAASCETQKSLLQSLSQICKPKTFEARKNWGKQLAPKYIAPRRRMLNLFRASVCAYNDALEYTRAHEDQRNDNLRHKGSGLRRYHVFFKRASKRAPLKWGDFKTRLPLLSGGV